jgi:hypothetical protein
MTDLSQRLRGLITERRLPWLNAAMAFVLLAYYWPTGAVWFGIVLCTGIAAVHGLRLVRLLRA